MVKFHLFDQQVQQVFYNIQQALASAQAQLQILLFYAFLLFIIILKHQILIRHIRSLWKDHVFPVCTLIPVTGLALSDMQIEIEATAYTA